MHVPIPAAKEIVMDKQHTVLVVRIENDAELPEATRDWCIRHAAETLGIVKAWFDYGPSNPTVALRSEEGTYKVHAPSATTLETLKTQLLPHEGLVIVSEEMEDGVGISPFDELRHRMGS